MTRSDWDARWLELATLIGSWSKDRNTKVGCVVIGEGGQVLTQGYNGLPRKVNDDIDARFSRAERDGRREKLRWTEHAERNAIYNAARTGTSLLGSSMYCPMYSCSDCARGIIQSGIAKVITTRPDWGDAFWAPEFEVSEIMFREAGVEIRFAFSVSP